MAARHQRSQRFPMENRQTLKRPQKMSAQRQEEYPSSWRKTYWCGYIVRIHNADTSCGYIVRIHSADTSCGYIVRIHSVDA